MTYEEVNKILPKYKERLASILGVLDEARIKVIWNAERQNKRELGSVNDLCSEFEYETCHFNIDLDDKTVTQFSLKTLPGCHHIMVSTASWVAPAFRNKGINKLTNEFRQQIAKCAGCCIMICTDLDGNTPERKTLAANGFKDIYSFKPRHQDNLIHLSLKEL